MPNGLGLFVGFGDVVEFDLDFEFAPAGFTYFEGFACLCFDVCISLVSFLLRGIEPSRLDCWVAFTNFSTDSESTHAA